MRIFLLGASGRTGSLVLAEALSRGHTVTALVRRPDSLSAQTGLEIIAGTPLNQADISTAFASTPESDTVGAVICALNNGRTSDNPWAATTAPKNFMADSVKNTLAVMREHGVKKIVVLGTRGVGSSRANFPWIMRIVVNYSNLKISFDDHEAVERLLKEEASEDDKFKWVEVRATGLDDTEKKEIKHWGNEGKGVGWWISRKSVAGFLLDAAEGDEWDGQTPVISN